MNTATDARAFAIDGYCELKNILAPALIRELREQADLALAQLVARMTAQQQTDPRVTWWRLPSGEPYVFKIKPVRELVPAVDKAAFLPELLERLQMLLGGPPHLMENKISYKQRVTVECAWAQLPVLGPEVHKHSDAAYFHSRGYTDPIATVAICLDDVGHDAGPIRVWPGSHRHKLPHLPTSDHGPVVPDTAAPDSDSVTLTTSAGSVLIWDSRLVHASEANTSGQPRRLLVLGYALP